MALERTTVTATAAARHICPGPFFLHLTRRSAIGTHPSKSRQPLLLCFSSNFFLCFFFTFQLFLRSLFLLCFSPSLSLSRYLSSLLLPQNFFFSASFASEQRFPISLESPRCVFWRVCARAGVSQPPLLAHHPTSRCNSGSKEQRTPATAERQVESSRGESHSLSKSFSMLFIQNLNGAVLVFAGVEVGWMGGAKAML